VTRLSPGESARKSKCPHAEESSLTLCFIMHRNHSDESNTGLRLKAKTVKPVEENTGANPWHEILY
jgi:hypothetical protein